jgi:hypothetical protein
MPNLHNRYISAEGNISQKNPEYMLNYSLSCSCSSNLSSFWLMLKQLKFHPPFFLFLAWWPSWLEVGITGHNFGRGPSKDHSTKVWFKLAQWLQRSWLKCEKLTDGRTDDRRRTPRFMWAKKDKWHNWSKLYYSWIKLTLITMYKSSFLYIKWNKIQLWKLVCFIMQLKWNSTTTYPNNVKKI